MICVCFFLPDLEVITYLEPLEEISLASYECAAECLLLHLKTFDWRDYRGTKVEKEVAIYILRNAKRLVTASIYPGSVKLPRFREFNDPLPSVCNPSSVPEYVSFHLETFQCSLYTGREEKREILLYILRNAPYLITSAVSVSSPDGLESELLLIEKWKCMPKASTSCQLVTRHR
ncbi:hypothetical protein DY000_02017482 [Brassica cretica]|uniref:FBD domain-containing protein n=1 Tax=Brassica cretica TaxID=69181 RepID=A0ABQ7DC76_BRACR|nr:hypothetical protein DY000_02017482 [Brassica cretica]